MDDTERSARIALDLLADLAETGFGAKELDTSNPAVGRLLFALGELHGLKAWQEQLRTNVRTVFTGMLNGRIAKLDARHFAAFSGSVFNDLDAANLEIARLRERLNEPR